jgi:hypothetical protein
LSKYGNRFFFTSDEVIEILNRLYTESGGEYKWRMLTLKDDGAKYSKGWQLKYIRIYKIKDKWIMCNAYNYALKREVFECEVDKEYTNEH